MLFGRRGSYTKQRIALAWTGRAAVLRRGASRWSALRTVRDSRGSYAGEG